MGKIAEFGIKIDGIEYVDREAVYGLLIKNGKVAVVKSPRGYFLPGGGVEYNETHFECLYREMIEEIGIVIELKEYVGRSVLYDRAPSDGVYYNMFGNFYLVNAIEVVEKTDDHLELVWMNLDEAKENLKLIHQVWAIKAVIVKENLSLI